MASSRARAPGPRAGPRRPRGVVTSRSPAPESPTSASASTTRAWRSAVRRRRATRGPKPTLSATSRCGKSAASWKTRPISRRCVGTFVRSRPSRSTRPRVGRRRPATTRRIVDLPAPLGPRSASRSPAATSSETSLTIDRPSSTTPRSSRASVIVCSARQATAPRRARRRATSAHEHDAERHRRTDVVLARPAEEAEDGDGHGRPVRSRDEDRRAELAERDREGKPGGDGERTSEERELDLAPDASRRGAEHGGRLAQPGVGRAQRRNEPRTTNGIATSACATGTIAGDERRSSGGSSNARRNPNPSIAAEAPSGSITSASSPPRPRATTTAAGIPTASAIAVATEPKTSELTIACHGATSSAGVSVASERKCAKPWPSPTRSERRTSASGGSARKAAESADDDHDQRRDPDRPEAARAVRAATRTPRRRSSAPETSTVSATAPSWRSASAAAVRRSKSRAAWL